MTITEYNNAASRRKTTTGKLKYANTVVAFLIEENQQLKEKLDNSIVSTELNKAIQKIKELQAENETLKDQVKHLDEENTKADAIIADRDQYASALEVVKGNLRQYAKDADATISSQKEEIRSLQLQIRKLTNDLEEAKLNSSAPQPKTHGAPIPNLPKGVSGVSYQLGRASDGRLMYELPGAGAFAMILPQEHVPPQTDAQKILNILKQLDPERMVFELSLVSKEVNKIISDNTAKASYTSSLLGKLS